MPNDTGAPVPAARAAERLSDGRRFLLGDAGHLSSPMGGEGVNAAFMDAADIAWKLALVVRGAAQPSLLASYAAERGAADHHVLAVSDEIHRLVTELIAMCAGGRAPVLPPVDRAENLAVMRRRSMLDVSYAGSALVGHTGVAVAGLAPGDRFPARGQLSGTGHHLIVLGAAPVSDQFRARWDGLVAIIDAAGTDLAGIATAMPEGGAILVRPDGFIGFTAVPADARTMAAIDAHLASYLMPLR
jgi:FAD binding domain